MLMRMIENVMMDGMVHVSYIISFFFLFSQDSLATCCHWLPTQAMANSGEELVSS